MHSDINWRYKEDKPLPTKRRCFQTAVFLLFLAEHHYESNASYWIASTTGCIALVLVVTRYS